MTNRQIARMYTLYASIMNILFVILSIAHIKDNQLYILLVILFLISSIDAIRNFIRCKKYTIDDIIELNEVRRR